MDGKDFKGTVTPTEARKTIFEDVLGFKQDDLAGVKIGFSGCRIIIFKLKQQFDVDELFEWQEFSFERSIGQDVSSIDCFIRGLRDPSKRKSQAFTVLRSAQPDGIKQVDDGTRRIRIMGCDYKLLESEVLDWLGMFGEVTSEIKEEIFDDPNDPDSKEMPPVGNGNYIVSMRLKKPLPNFMPMYGRRICLEHTGIRKQCNWCYGFHFRKYCKNEKMGLEEYAERFRIQHPGIPEPYYGRLAKSVESSAVNLISPDLQAAPAAPADPVAVDGPAPVHAKPNEEPIPKLSLRRDSLPGAPWVTVGSSSKKAQNKSANTNKSSDVVTTRMVAEQAVTGMINVFRATFRQPTTQTTNVENIQVPAKSVMSSVTSSEKVAPKGQSTRTSSASRGRGISKNLKD